MDHELPTLLDRVWSRLSRGVADRKHPARHPTLATIGQDGPELRTLVLRGVDREASMLELHTDMASPKVAQIVAEPRVALHVWIPRDRLQIRLKGQAIVERGDPALFARLPAAARANYGGAVPGSPPGQQTKEGDPARFGAIRLTVHEIDALVLAEPHIRAIYTAPDWAGRWVTP